MRVVVPLWLAVLTAVSLAPDRLKFRLGTKGAFHRADHVIIFALTGLVFCWSASSVRSRVLRAAGACLAAFVLEWMEAFFYENPVEWGDVWIGCLGAGLGFLLATILHAAHNPAPFVRK
ncbi:MAG: hypothetical protein JO097_14795 [Acidobacteriaceae bacterium]|nr:hypothetical protein [Acidobacteriaceae bacterium]